MERAKAAASEFLNKSGHHDSTVRETVAPSVTTEHVTPTRHENVITAVDREVHQDHHHTTVLPVEDQEILPEKHHHRMAGVQHKEFDRGDHDRTRSTLETERAQYTNTSTTHDTKHTQSIAPQLEGEHVHHHVHETVQPVVNKQTIAPSVVHTTVPIHETHHEEARHHETTTLPTMTMDEFKKHGGSLTGQEQRDAAYDGCPDPSNPAGFHGGKGLHLDGKHPTEDSSGHVHSDTCGHNMESRLDQEPNASGTTNYGTDSGLDKYGHSTGRSNVDSGLTGTRHGGTDGAIGTSNTGPTGTHHHGTMENAGTTGTTGATRGADGILRNDQSSTQPSSYGKSDAGLSPQSTTTSDVSAPHKASLMDRLNPMRDSDGDGKKGFMK